MELSHTRGQAAVGLSTAGATAYVSGPTSIRIHSGGKPWE
jgi:hypothetical protein